MRKLTVGLITILALMVAALWSNHAVAATTIPAPKYHSLIDTVAKVHCPEGSEYVCKRNNKCFCRAYRGSGTYTQRRRYVRPYVGRPYVGRPYVRRWRWW
jgi:hypothetical protein